MPEVSTEDEDGLGAGIAKGIPLPLLEYFVKSRSLGDRGGVLRPRSRSVNDIVMCTKLGLDCRVGLGGRRKYVFTRLCLCRFCFYLYRHEYVG